jgi:hypothetical protein
MKLRHILTEAVKQGDSNTAVYNLVLANLKTDKDTLSDIKDKMFNTDTFWVSELDQVNKAMNTSVDQAIDEIFMAADAIGDSIKDHYHDAWNHAPGYKKPSKLDFSSDDISYNDALEVVKRLNPAIYDKHVADHEAARKAASAKQKELIKALQPLLPALAQSIIHSFDTAWNNYFKWLKANPNSLETKNFIEDRKIDLTKLKNGKELAQAVKAAETDEEWMHDTYETLINGDDLDEADRQTLVSVMYHKNTAKKLWSMIANKVAK